MSSIFDTHAHYDDEQFAADRGELLAAMPENGVGRIIDPGCDMETSRSAVGLAHTYPHLYAAVGWHPENCAAYTPESLEIIRSWAKDEKVVAIGEIGLDYHWEENPSKEWQQEVFRAQLKLAAELNLPVIVHDRDAHSDCLAIVKEFPDLRGVFHCYSGSAEMARELLSLGWYLGFDGPLTYRNAKKAIAVAQEVPLDKMLIETDSPYLPPEGRRGTRNDSRNLTIVAEKLAEIRGTSADEIIRITDENGRRLFGI